MEPKLVPLTRSNWEAYSKLQVHENQRYFIPDNLFIIAESRFEKTELLGIEAAFEPVGLVALGNWGGLTWLSRIMIDSHYQRLGLGKAGIQAVLQHCKRKQPGFLEVRTTVSIENSKVIQLFESCGFQRINEFQDVEVIMVWQNSM